MQININKNFFSQQSEPHKAKLSLSVVLSIFKDIHRELFFLDIIMTISEMSNEIVRKIVFLTMLERGKS